MSETQLEVGDRVRTITMPSEFRRDAYGAEPSEVVGRVVDIVEETKQLGPSNTMEQTFALIEGDDGAEKRVNVEHLNREIDGEDGGVTIQVLDEAADEDESESDSEVACDGGADVTEHADDETIADAIAQHDDPDHEDALIVDEVRDLLAHIQTDTEMVWGEWMDNIERDDSRVVAQDDDVVVLDTGEHDTVRRALETYTGPVTVDDIAERVVSTVHHRVAEQIAPEYNWGVAYPHVIRLPTDGESNQQLVEAVINSLLRRGLSPGQAWAYYGVEIRGHSRNAWSKRCGYSDHSAVSEPLRKAKSKLP